MLKKKVVHIVGNRPQFIKLAPVSAQLRERGAEELIIHTGQHYDANMSDIFFEELGIPKPYINLGIGSGSHAEMTAKALCGLERELEKISPDIVLIYGDTDSTLAGALAASKLNIPLAHIEAGERTFNKTNPEEKNRIVADHLSDLLFCSDNSSYENLRKEGCGDHAFVVGDVMYDTYKRCMGIEKKKVCSEDYVLMTWHRAENTCSYERMNNILEMIRQIPELVICPMHPRTRTKLQEYDLMRKAEQLDNFEVISPLGYLEMMNYVSGCKWILTDSGGLSKESSFAGVRCLFMLELDVWKELRDCGWITQVNPDNKEDVENKLRLSRSFVKVDEKDVPHCFGDGNASRKIVDILQQKQYI